MPKYRTAHTGINKVNKKVSLYYGMKQNDNFYHLCGDSFRTFHIF